MDVREIRLSNQDLLKLDVDRGLFRVALYVKTGGRNPREGRFAHQGRSLVDCLRVIFSEAESELRHTHDAETVAAYIRATVWGETLPAEPSSKT